MIATVRTAQLGGRQTVKITLQDRGRNIVKITIRLGDCQAVITTVQLGGRQTMKITLQVGGRNIVKMTARFWDTTRWSQYRGNDGKILGYNLVVAKPWK